MPGVWTYPFIALMAGTLRSRCGGSVPFREDYVCAGVPSIAKTDRRAFVRGVRLCRDKH